MNYLSSTFLPDIAWLVLWAGGCLLAFVLGSMARIVWKNRRYQRVAEKCHDKARSPRTTIS